MLTLHSIITPRDSRRVLESFDPSVATWVVSDLKSKLDLNRRLLESREFLPGESVIRASELWKTLLTRVRPDLQIVSREFIVTLLAQKLTTLEIEWAQAPGAAQTAYDYMTQLMPVLAHPQGEEMMKEWLSTHSASESRWGRWFDLSVQLWKAFLDDGFIAPPWVSGVLVNEAGLEQIWSRPLIVDLGAELNQVEADLLVQMAGFVDVTVLRPEPEWIGEYKKTVVAYELFERKLKVNKTSSRQDVKATAAGTTTPSAPIPASYRKYTTMIAEVKDATAQTRRWLESGIEPSRIAIVAPDIEAYWPSLSAYFEQEGIPCQKDQVRRLHSYPDIARWLAYLRLRTGSHAETDIELALFDTSESKMRVITYDRFRTLYSVIYGREDLERSGEVAQLFVQELTPQDEVWRDDFIAWALKQLPEETEFTRVESIFKRLFAECPQGTKLCVRRWLGYLEQLTARVECRVSDGDPDGVAILNLSSAENSPATQMIVLGLTESALKSSGGTAILFSDVGSLAYEFGFYLASEDQAKLEFEARWITENPDRELVLSVPETDFAGSAQAASWLWVRGARHVGDHDTLTIPDRTRWDELQRAGLVRISSERGWTPAQTLQLTTALEEDLEMRELSHFGMSLVRSLSPSGIEDYLNCPFVFAAKRLFGLSDVSEIDLEVDPSRRGSLMHKLFELLTEEPVRFDRTDDELAAVVDDARAKSSLVLADERLWAPLKARHVDLARRFLAVEKDFRTRFPETKTIAREFDIAGYLRPSTGELIRDEEEGALRFVGRIDRIDADQHGHLAIYDYKSSAGSVSQFGGWLKKNQIQLLLYSIAIERGLTMLEPRPVLAALYYVARPLGRDYGFKVEDVDQALYEIGDKRKKNRITTEQKERLFAEGVAIVKSAVEGVIDGHFKPTPRDEKDCFDCHWSALCRAPHLNP